MFTDFALIIFSFPMLKRSLTLFFDDIVNIEKFESWEACQLRYFSVVIYAVKWIKDRRRYFSFLLKGRGSWNIFNILISLFCLLLTVSHRWQYHSGVFNENIIKRNFFFLLKSFSVWCFWVWQAVCFPRSSYRNKLQNHSTNLYWFLPRSSGRDV